VVQLRKSKLLQPILTLLFDPPLVLPMLFYLLKMANPSTRVAASPHSIHLIPNAHMKRNCSYPNLASLAPGFGNLNEKSENAKNENKVCEFIPSAIYPLHDDVSPYLSVVYVK
jgi:hypothetical protein